MTNEVFGLLFVIVVIVIIVSCFIFDYIYMKKKVQNLKPLTPTPNELTEDYTITIFSDNYDLVITFKNGDKVTYDKISPLEMKVIYEDLLNSDKSYLRFQHSLKDVNINQDDIRSYSILQSYVSKHISSTTYLGYDYRDFPSYNTNLWNNYTCSYSCQPKQESKSKKMSWNDRYNKLLEEEDKE